MTLNTFPFLLNARLKAHKLDQVDGIPKSSDYDVRGQLVAPAIDMRTEPQFLAMLAQAG